MQITQNRHHLFQIIELLYVIYMFSAKTLFNQHKKVLYFEIMVITVPITGTS